MGPQVDGHCLGAVSICGRSAPASALGRSIQRKRKPSEVEKTDSSEDVESAEKSYDDSRKRGEGLKDKGLDWYTEKPTATQPISTNSTHASVLAKGYRTFWKTKGQGTIFELATQRGSRLKLDQSGEVSSFGDAIKGWEGDLGTDVLYGNEFNVLTGKFSAFGNWGNIDDDVAEEEDLPARLPNSEIIWHQQAIARDVFAADGGPPAALSSIARSQISNEETLETLLFCDDWPVANGGGSVTLDDPLEDDTWALLGSPNGNSSVYVLMQHGDEFGGVDISDITYESDGGGAPPDMIITYVTQ